MGAYLPKQDKHYHDPSYNSQYNAAYRPVLNNANRYKNFGRTPEEIGEYNRNVVTDIPKAVANVGIGAYEAGANLLNGSVLPDDPAYAHIGRIPYGIPEYGRALETMSSAGLSAYTLGKGTTPSKTPLSALNLSRSDQAIIAKLSGKDGMVVVNGQQIPIARLANDINVSSVPPPPKNLMNRAVGRSAAQNRAVQKDAEYLKSIGAGDVRINQQQVNQAECRVGICRPDLQGTLPSGKRIYIEYDRRSSKRGPKHASRILSNDANGIVILKTVD